MLPWSASRPVGPGAPVTVVTRLRLDAALYDPAPPRRLGQIERPRLKRSRWPTLAAVVADPRTVWTELTVAQGYGLDPRTVAIAAATAVGSPRGLPPEPLRWVLIRDPPGSVPTQALLCTDLPVAPAPILAWFVQRWPLEVTFEEARPHLGLETQRQWSAAAIRRTTPVLLGLVSLVTLLAYDQKRDPRSVVRQPPGTASDSQPVPMREHWSDASCGRTRLFPRPHVSRRS